MALILECFDGELVERTKTALDEAAIVYSLTAYQEELPARWQIAVSDTDLARGAAIAEAVGLAIESERSPMPCQHCGTGMLVVDPASPTDQEEPLVLEYRCPQCGAAGLTGIQPYRGRP